jgi:hypothetical protein
VSVLGPGMKERNIMRQQNGIDWRGPTMEKETKEMIEALRVTRSVEDEHQQSDINININITLLWGPRPVDGLGKVG